MWKSSSGGYHTPGGLRGESCRKWTAWHPSSVRRLKFFTNANSRIIIPGNDDGRFPGRGRPSNQDNSPGNNRLFIPGNERNTGQSIDTTGIQGPSTSTFRPPPGFMDTSNPKAREYGPLDMHEARQALDRIRSQAGHWHELALLLPRLAASGYDAQVVEFETGLERVIQNAWIVAQSVHESLQKSGQLSEETMEYFSHSDGADKLYHLRFLTNQARMATAQYIADQQYDAVESGILGKAVKEHERRDGESLGFSPSPADCLAFRYYRDAIESRDPRQTKELIEKALSYAETESASKAIRALSEHEVDQPGVKGKEEAKLEVVRLTGEEIEFKPVVLVGEMTEVSSNQVRSAGGVKQAGVYNSFRVTQAMVDQEFVALPAFRSLLFAKRPVALSVADCATEPLILKATRVKNEEDKRRQSGPGLVVIDLADSDSSEEGGPSAESYYVQQRGDSCALVAGDSITDSRSVLGRVLFLCRPPARSAAARLNSYALMSV